MVFDEVDAGVGGRAAVEVGRRLARLSREHQVVVVTHLAQVAAYADRHIVVDKQPAPAPAVDGRATSGSWHAATTGSPNSPGCWAAARLGDRPASTPPNCCATRGRATAER